MSTYDLRTSVLLYTNHLVLDCVWMIRLSFTLHTVSWFMTWLFTCDSFNGMNVSLSQVILHTMRLDHCGSWVLRNDWFLGLFKLEKPVFLLLMGYEVSRQEVWSPRRKWTFTTFGRGLMVLLVLMVHRPGNQTVHQVSISRHIAPVPQVL